MNSPIYNYDAIEYVNEYRDCLVFSAFGTVFLK